jgi:hypothetical protein
MSDTPTGKPVFEAFTTILSSPVGGWALACLFVAGAAYVMRSDMLQFQTQGYVMIQDVKRITEKTQEQITEARTTSHDNTERIRKILELLEEHVNRQPQTVPQ